jgi:single-strand DNA-binding protein
MPTLNRVQLIGRLGKDPESRFTPSGKKYTYFSLAVSNVHKNANGETVDDTDWINIEAWGRVGEICDEYLHKGSLIYVEGRLRIDRYEDEGQTKYFTKVVVFSMQMLDKKPADEAVVQIEEEPGEYEALELR